MRTVTAVLLIVVLTVVDWVVLRAVGQEIDIDQGIVSVSAFVQNRSGWSGRM